MLKEWSDPNTTAERKEEIRKMLRHVYGNSNMSDTEIKKRLSKMNDEGCSYVAATNSILNHYKDKKELFKQRFGIDYDTKDGKPNFDELLLYFYRDENDKKTAEWWDVFHWGKEVYSPTDGVTPEQEDSNIETFLKDHGVNQVDMKQINPDQVQSELNAGSSVVLNAYSGSKIVLDNGETVELEGGHAMSVIAVNPDGSYVVSTWGHKATVYPSGNYNVRSVHIDDK